MRGGRGAGRRRVLLTTLLLVAGGSLAPFQPTVAAQTADPEPPAYLAVREVTPTVAETGTWRARFELTREPPPGSLLRVTVHQPLPPEDGRERLDEIARGGSAGPTLHNPVTVPLEGTRVANAATLELGVRSGPGDPNRLLIPNPGVHPVTVELLTLAGDSLQTQVVYLNRAGDDERPPVRVATLLTVSGPPLVAPDSTPSVPDPARQEVERAIALLDAAPTAPVTVDVDPQLFDVPRTTGAAQDGDLVDGLVEVIGQRPRFRRPWAPIDTESWGAAQATAVVEASLRAGQVTTNRELGRGGTRDLWPIDPRLGPRSLPLLDSLGVDHVVVRPDQLQPVADPAAPITDRRIRLGTAGSGVDALVTDPVVEARLRDPGSSAALAAHLAVTEILAARSAAPADTATSAVIDLTPLSTAVALELLAALEDADPTLLDATSLDEAFDAAEATVTTRRRTEPVVRQLRALEVRPEEAIAEELVRLRDRAASYHSSFPDPPDLAPLDQVILTTTHRDLDAAAQLGYIAEARRRVDDDLARIVPPPERSVTVTARTSQLPFRIVNETGREVTVLLRFGGRRLEVNGGRPQRVVLVPGANSVSVPVLARTSGDFVVRVELRTGDDRLLIGTTSIRVRSTVVSGAGIVLGGSALAFLVVWWVHTIRRDRRRRRAAAPPPEEPASVA